MGDRTETFVVGQSEPGQRLDTFLRRRYGAVSRSALQRLIEAGHITVDGKPVKPTHAPRAGETVRVFWPEARPAEAAPEDMPLEVLYEDSDVLVVNKPAGVVVHPSAGHDAHTLVNALLHHCRGQLSGIGGVQRPGIVHRLDLETSGCLVVAKSDAAHQALTAQFAARQITKVYHAILCGVLPRDQGDIRAAIARHPTHRKRMAVDEENGRDAWTSYRVLERWTEATLAEALLHTGRTHQIRVHFQFLGHPLAGDATYGARANQRLAERTGVHAPRVMLHAHRLSFVHPRTGRTVTREAPWPADFEAAAAALRGRAADPT
ncbi:MAG: RluA family pseudouridine synthase [Verrucomicrobia bacterium]|nr:RluA family pseudouridine synthase [Verrucomicrobiota bacterium]